MNTHTVVFLSVYFVVGIFSILLLNLWDFVLGRDIFGAKPIFSLSLDFWRDYREETFYWWTSDWSIGKMFFVGGLALFWPIGDVCVFVQIFKWLMDKVDDTLIEK